MGVSVGGTDVGVWVAVAGVVAVGVGEGPTVGVFVGGGVGVTVGVGIDVGVSVGVTVGVGVTLPKDNETYAGLTSAPLRAWMWIFPVSPPVSWNRIR